MAVKKISDSILYVGADDTTLDLFESQYPVPGGITYNSYVIKGVNSISLHVIPKLLS